MQYLNASFDTLPPEIQLDILDYLDTKALSRVMQSNSRIYEFVKTSTNWKERLKRDIPQSFQDYAAIPAHLITHEFYLVLACEFVDKEKIEQIEKFTLDYHPSKWLKAWKIIGATALAILAVYQGSRIDWSAEVPGGGFPRFRSSGPMPKLGGSSPEEYYSSFWAD